MSVQAHLVSSALELTSVPMQLTNYDCNEDTVQKMECKLTSRNNGGQPIIVQVEHIVRSKPKSSTEKPQFGATFGSLHSKKSKSPKTNDFTPEQERKTIAAIIDLSSKDEEIAGVAAKRPDDSNPLETSPNDPRLISGADDAHSHLPPSSADSSIDDVAQRLARMPWHPHPPEDEYEISCCGWKKVKKPQLHPGVARGPWDFHPPAANAGNLQRKLEDEMSVDSNWPPEMAENEANRAECYCVDHNDVWLKEHVTSAVRRSNSDECYCHGPKMNIPLPLYEEEIVEVKELGKYTEPVIIQQHDEAQDQQESIGSPTNETTTGWQHPQIISHDPLQTQPATSPYSLHCDQSSTIQHHCEPLHQDDGPDNLIHHQWHCEPLFSPDQGDSAYNSYERNVSFAQENPSNAGKNKHLSDPNSQSAQPKGSVELIIPPTPPLKSYAVSESISEENRQAFAESKDGIGAFNIYSTDALSSKLAEKMIKKVRPPSPPANKRESITDPTIKIIPLTPNKTPSTVSPRLKVVLSPDENWKKLPKVMSPSESDREADNQRINASNYDQGSPIVDNFEIESMRSSPSISLPPTPDKKSPERLETPASEYMTPSPKCKSLVKGSSPNHRSLSKGSQEFFETQRYPSPMELQNAPCMSVPEVKRIAESALEVPKFAVRVCRCAPEDNKCSVVKCSFEVPKCVDDQCCLREVPRCCDVPRCPQEVQRCYDVPRCPQEVQRCVEVPACCDVPECPESSSCPRISVSRDSFDERDVQSGVPSCHCLPTVTDNSSGSKQMYFPNRRKCEKPPSEPLPEAKKMYSPSFNKSQPSVHVDPSLPRRDVIAKDNQSVCLNESSEEAWSPSNLQQFQANQQFDRNSQIAKNPFELLRQPYEESQSFWQGSSAVADGLNFLPDFHNGSSPSQYADLAVRNESWREHTMAAKKINPWLYSENENRATPTGHSHIQMAQERQLVASLIHCCDFVCPPECPKELATTSPCRLVNHQPSTPPISLQKPFVSNAKPVCEYELGKKIYQQQESPNCGSKVVIESTIQEPFVAQSKLKYDGIQVKVKSKVTNIQPPTEQPTVKPAKKIQKISPDIKVKSPIEELHLKEEYVEHLNIAPHETTEEKKKRFISPNLCRHESEASLPQEQHSDVNSVSEKSNPITKFQSPRSRTVDWQWHPQAFVICPTTTPVKPEKPKLSPKAQKSLMMQHLEISPEEHRQCKPKRYHQCSTMCNAQRCISPSNVPQMMCNALPCPRLCGEMSTPLQHILCSCNSAVTNPQLHEMSTQCLLERDPSVIIAAQRHLTNDAPFSSHSKLSNYSCNYSRQQLLPQEPEVQLQRQIILQPRGKVSTITQELSSESQQHQQSQAVACQNQETQTVELPTESLHYVLESHYQLHPRNKSVATETSETDLVLSVSKLGKLFEGSDFTDLKLGNLPLTFSSSKSFHSHSKKSSSSEVSSSKTGRKKHKVYPYSSSDTSSTKKDRSKSCRHTLSQCPSNTETRSSDNWQSNLGNTYRHSTGDSIIPPLQSHKKKYNNQQIHKHCSYGSSVSPSTVSLPTSNIQPNGHCWYCHQPVNPIPQTLRNANPMPILGESAQPMANVGPMPQMNFFKIAYIPVQYMPQSPQMIPRLYPNNYPLYGAYHYPLFEEDTPSATSSNSSTRSSPTNARSRQHVCMPEEMETEYEHQAQEMCSCHDDHESEYSIADSGCVTPTPFDSNCAEDARKALDVESHMQQPVELDEARQGRRTCSVLQFASDVEEDTQNHRFHNCQCSSANLRQPEVCSKLKLVRPIISPPLARAVPTSQSLPTEFEQNAKGRAPRMKKSPRLNKSPVMDVGNGRSVSEAPGSHLHANSSMSEPLINGYQPAPSAWTTRRCNYHIDQGKAPEERSVSCVACRAPNSPKLKCACSVLAFNTSPTSQGDPCPAESPSTKTWLITSDEISDDAVQDVNLM